MATPTQFDFSDAVLISLTPVVGTNELFDTRSDTVRISQLSGVTIKILEDHLRSGERNPAMLSKFKRIVKHIVNLHDAISRASQLVPRNVILPVR